MADFFSASDVKLRYDLNRLGDLVSDDGQRVSPASLDANTVLLAVMDDAESTLLGEILTGKRYTEADLEGLEGRDKNLMIRILCDLTYGYLLLRRGHSEQDISRLAPGFRVALEYLSRLRAGEIVFNVESVKEAGTLARVVLSRNVNLVSSATRLFGDLNLQ